MAVYVTRHKRSPEVVAGLRSVLKIAETYGMGGVSGVAPVLFSLELPMFAIVEDSTLRSLLLLIPSRISIATGRHLEKNPPSRRLHRKNIMALYVP
jgi:hypothetical protein